MKGMMIRNLLVASVLALSMASCLKDVNAICVIPDTYKDGVRLNFEFDAAGTNVPSSFDFSENVKDLYVYTFDHNTGLLVDIQRVSSDQLVSGSVDLPIVDGVYDFVAWGGSSTNMIDGFSTFEADGSGDPLNYAPVEIGSTTKDQFRMMIMADPMPGDSKVGIPYAKKFDDLFYAYADNDGKGIKVQNGVDRLPEVFTFERNTHVLQIKVDGLQHIDAVVDKKTRAGAGTPPLDIYVIGKNGMYVANNSIATEPNTLFYAPYEESDNYSWDETTMTADITVLKIDHFTHGYIDPIMLYVDDTKTGTNLVELNVLSEVMKNQNNIFAKPEDLANTYKLNINVLLTEDGGLQVDINEWVVIELEPNL